MRDNLEALDLVWLLKYTRMQRLILMISLRVMEFTSLMERVG